MHPTCFNKLVLVDCENVSSNSLERVRQLVGDRRTEWRFFGHQPSITSWLKRWSAVIQPDLQDRGSFWTTSPGKDSADAVIETHAIELLFDEQSHGIRDVFLVSSDTGFKTMKNLYRRSKNIRLNGVGDHRVCKARRQDFQRFLAI